MRLSARNVYDWGPHSELLEIAAAGVPEQMAVPVTEIDPNNGQNILVTWIAPYDNSDPVIAYEIVFKSNVDGLYSSVAGCVSELPSLTLSCSVPMTTFIEPSTFNLGYNDLLRVRGRARNTNDWGDYSESNIDGARIQTTPLKMGQTTRGSNTSTTQIEAIWTTLTGDDTGGVAIDSYNLQWDKGSDENEWYDLIG